MSGGGGQSTTSHAEYPAEFRPLAASAVNQIQSLQNSLPLAQFGQWTPQSVPELSPLQQQALSLIPSLTKPTTGMNSLQRGITPLSANTLSAFDAGRPTDSAQASLNSLSASGRVGPSQLKQGPVSTQQMAQMLPLSPADRTSVFDEGTDPISNMRGQMENFQTRQGQLQSMMPTPSTPAPQPSAPPESPFPTPNFAQTMMHSPLAGQQLPPQPSSGLPGQGMPGQPMPSPSPIPLSPERGQYNQIMSQMNNVPPYINWAGQPMWDGNPPLASGPFASFRSQVNPNPAYASLQQQLAQLQPMLSAPLTQQMGG